MIHIRIPDIFNQGPRHALAKSIWAAAADHWGDEVAIDMYPHQGTHRDALRSWWFHAHKHPDTVQVFTETDFLPEPTFLKAARADAALYGLTGPQARHRDCGKSLPVDHSPQAGAWLLVAAPERIRQLDFSSSEPGRSLPEECPGMNLLAGEWQDPGLYYPGYGLHTFWSRAWHDDAPAGGAFDLEDIRQKIDVHLQHYREIWNV